MQEVENFQLLASTSPASEVADFLYFTRASSDATSQEVVFLASGEACVNRIIGGFRSCILTIIIDNIAEG